MSAVERLAILIEANGGGAVREFQKVGNAAERDLGRAESRADKLGARMTTTGAVMMSAAAVMAAGMWNAGQAAADLEQAVGGTDAVFKENAGVVQDWSKGMDQAAGLSQEAALRLSTQLGGALKNLGFDMDEAVDKSMELTELGADLAATYGGTTTEAVQALGAAFRGEFDPAERFNLFLKQSEVDAKAVAMGLAGSTSEVDRHARAQATLALIMEQSTDAQGQFAREADTTSGALAISRAEFENTKAEIGAGFLPVMSQVAGIVGKATGAVSSLNDASGGLFAQAAGWGTVALGVGGAASFIIGQVISMRENFGKAASKAGEFARSMLTVDGAIKGVRFAAAAGLVALLVSQMNKGADAAREYFNEWQGGEGDIDTRLKRARAELEKYSTMLDEMGVKSSSLNLGFTEAYFLSSDAAKVADLRDAASGLVDELEKEKDAAGGAAVQVNTLAAAQADAEAATSGHTEAAKAQNEALRAAFDPVFGMISAQQGIDEAQRSGEESSLKLYFAQVALNEARKNHAAGSPEVVEAERAVAEATRGVEQANIDGAKAAVDFDSMMTNLVATARENPDAFNEAKLKIDAYQAANIISAESANYMRGKIDEAAAAARNVPDGKTTHFDAYTDPALTKIDQLIGKVWEATRDRVINFRANVLGAFGFGDPAGRASGGPLEPWSVYRLHDTPNAEVANIGGQTLLFTGQDSGSVTNLGNQSAAVGVTAPAGMGAAADRPLVVQLVVDGRTLAEVARPHLRDLDRMSL